MLSISLDIYKLSSYNEFMSDQPAPSTEESAKTKNNDKIDPKLASIITIIVVIISSGVVAWIYFTPKPSQPVVQNAPSPAPGKPTIPVSLSNPAVKNIGAKYEFKAQLKEIKKKEKILALITDINGIPDDGIPEKFDVDSKTKIFTVKNGLKKEASSSALKIGQKLEITTTYSFIRQKWSNVSTVDILVP